MSKTSNVLTPNSAGYIHHWLISGPKEELYRTDYFNPNQLTFEKKMREIIADDSLKTVPSDIRLDAPGLEQFGWRYYQAFNNWFVDLSKFYFLLSKFEMYASTIIHAPTDRKIKARLWTFEAVEIWVNGEKVLSLTEPVYKPIQYMDFDLPLHAGDNDIFVRVQDLGVRDTRNIFGLQLREDFSDISIKTHDFEKVLPLIRAEEELLQVAVRDGKLLLDHEPSHPICINDEMLWEQGREFLLSGKDIALTLSMDIDGTKVERKVENTGLDVPVYGSADTLEEHRKNWYANLRKIYSDGLNIAVTYANLLEGRLEDTDFQVIRQLLPNIHSRKDCADFDLYDLLRILYTGGNLLPEDLKEEAKNVVLNFRYWMDEKGSDGMCFWSENHALCFYACQLMAGKLYPEELFTRSGRTGSQQYELACSRCREWLDSIEATAFEEFLSPVYMPVTLTALLGVIDYGEAEISERAAKVADKILELLCTHIFQGGLVAPFGRIYGTVIKPFQSPLLSNLSYFDKSIPVGQEGTGGKLIPLLALSSYEVPMDVFSLLIEEIHKVYQTGNTQVSVCKKKDYILTSVASERDESFVGGWSGEEARKEDPYKTGNFSFMYVKALNEKYHGTTLIQPGVYGYQQHLWSAALSGESLVFVNHPGATHHASSMRPGYWYGNGLFPALKQWDNILLAVYSLEDKHPVRFTHVYFPKHTFDEVRQDSKWLFARKGNGFLGIWCSSELTPHNDYLTDCEYRAYEKDQGYVCLCSDLETEGSFDAFCSKCIDMRISFDLSTLTLNDGLGHEIKYVARYNDSQAI